MTADRDALMAQVHGRDVWEGMTPEAEPPDLQGWGSTAPVFERLIAEVRPRLVLEIGTWKGASAVHMARACARLGLDATVVCLDTWLGAREMVGLPPDHQTRGLRADRGWPQVYPLFLRNVLAAGVADRVVPIPQTSRIGTRWLREAGWRFDLVYVDASHDEADVREDVLAALDLRRDERSVVFGDDWSPDWPGVERAVSRIGGEMVPGGPGLALELDLPHWVLRTASR